MGQVQRPKAVELLMEGNFHLIRLFLKIFGMKLGLQIYNYVATDTKRPVEEEAVAPTYTGPIKLPPFYDLSHWKIVNNWDGISPAPLLLGTKATQGTSYRDPTFPEYFQNFTSRVHCRRLAYHYFEKTMDPVAQANWFCDYIQPYLTNADVLCLDFEQGGETAPMLWAFLNRVHQRYPSNLVIIYSRKNLMDPITMTSSEATFFKGHPSWPAGYPTDPSGFTTCPPGYIPDQNKWGPVWAWQYTDSGHVTGIDGDTDCNLIEPPFISWLGGVLPEPPEDEITQPFVGVTRIVGRRFDSDVYVTRIEPYQVRFHVAHEIPFDNGLLLVSQVSQKYGAQLGWNGDEWDKNQPLPAFPKNIAFENGGQIVARVSAEPSLNIRQNGTTEIIHQTNRSEYNTSTGRRYLIENGQIKQYLYGNEPQYTEIHPRGLTGIRSDGVVIMVTVDGRSNVSRGVTLLEGAQILLEFGASKGYDRGGGGDAVDVMNGIVQNVPSDVGPNGQPGVERAVPQAILVYATEEQMSAYKYDATAIGDGTRIRTDHNTSANYLNSYPAGTVFSGDELFTAPSDLYNNSGQKYQSVGDKWLKIIHVNGQPPRNSNGNTINQAVWVAIIHMGGNICTLVENNPDPEPEPTDRYVVRSVLYYSDNTTQELINQATP